MDYWKIKQLLISKYKSERQSALAIGMSPEGFSTMMENHTMTVEKLEIILNELQKPVSFFFDEKYIIEEPTSPYHTKCNNPQCLFEINELMEQIKDLKYDKRVLSMAIEKITREGGAEDKNIPKGGVETSGEIG